VMTIALVGWALAAGNPSASGHGDIIVNTPLGPSSIQYSFVAQELKSGVQGQAEILFGPAGDRFHVEVDCLSFTAGPNPIATVGGFIKNIQSVTPPGPPEGLRVRFSMRDNGEGANDPPDQLTGPAFAPPGSPVVCPVALGPFNNTEGNIQVRP